MIIEKTYQLVEELNRTNSKLDKIAILKKYPECKELLRYVYDPLIKFYVTSDNVKKFSNSKKIVETVHHYETLFDLLTALSSRSITGHEALTSVGAFIRLQDSKYTELIYNIIDKNLKTRTDAKIINKAFPKLISLFSVALADKYKPKLVDLDKCNYFVSRKLDGVRVITVVKNHIAVCYSRTGNEFLTLDNVKSEVERIARELNIDNFVLDGEMCVIQENGLEDFKSIVSQIKRKNYTVKNPKYKLFDFIGLEAFNNKKSKSILSNRLKVLNTFFQNKSDLIDVLEQIPVTSLEQLKTAHVKAVGKGWEGLILRKDTIYQGKRSKDMLKMKKFHDAEYKVQSVEVGPFRIIGDNGLEETIETVTNIIINHKGNKVSVGSGFSLEQRKYYFENKHYLKNATVNVQFFEETKDKQGNIRLRFPVIKYVYEDGRKI